MMNREKKSYKNKILLEKLKMIIYNTIEIDNNSYLRI